METDIGKFLNGYNTALYADWPKGWDVADVLVSYYSEPDNMD